jgi:hypothetical protein
LTDWLCVPVDRGKNPYGLRVKMRHREDGATGRHRFKGRFDRDGWLIVVWLFERIIWLYWEITGVFGPDFKGGVTGDLSHPYM